MSIPCFHIKYVPRTTHYPPLNDSQQSRVSNPSLTYVTTFHGTAHRLVARTRGETTRNKSSFPESTSGVSRFEKCCKFTYPCPLLLGRLGIDELCVEQNINTRAVQELKSLNGTEQSPQWPLPMLKNLRFGTRIRITDLILPSQHSASIEECAHHQCISHKKLRMTVGYL